MTVPFTTERPRAVRVDQLLIAEMVKTGSRVLDVGCGDGALLEHLRGRGVDGRGIELSQVDVKACVRRGLSVIQGDAEEVLADYPTQAFDYVILSQTLQAMRNPRRILDGLLRIGKRAIVSFPNFGYWRVRWDLMTQGRMPVTRTLTEQWHDTPNIHLCTIRDFVALCNELGITIEEQIFVDHKGQATLFRTSRRLSNLLAEQGLFRLTRTEAPPVERR